jgi:hypothetical protein
VFWDVWDVKNPTAPSAGYRTVQLGRQTASNRQWVTAYFLKVRM